jgi:hypothetical protein
LLKIILAGVQPSNDKWKLARGFQTSVLNIKAVSKYHGLLNVEIMQVMLELLGATHFSEIFDRYSTCIIHTLAYGKRLDRVDDDTL